MSSEDRAEAEKEPSSEPGFSEGSKSQLVFSKLRREVNEDELINNPAAIRMMLSMLDQLERQMAQLINFRERFYERDKLCAVFEERSNKSIRHEVLYSAALGLGCTLIGLAPSLMEKVDYAWMVPVSGAIIILLSVLSKVVKK